MASQGFPYLSHTLSSQAEIFYFKEVTNAPVTSVQVKRFTHTDPVMSEVLDMVTRGKGVLSDNLQPYLVRRNELTVQFGCLLWGFRVIIPPPLRQVLEELHSGHCGMVRMKKIAPSYFWWPGLEAAIEDTVKSCPACQ
jgi:hypothetical protein